MIQTGKITALYARFSHDEGNSGHDSNSIANQKELLAEYANTHGFINHQFTQTMAIPVQTLKDQHFKNDDRC